MEQNRKVLLIDPPFYRIFGFYNRYFPFGLVTLATFLKENNILDVKVYDADFNKDPQDIDYSRLPQKYRQYLDSFKDPNNPVWQDVEDVIRKENPRIVGISVWTTFAAASFYTAKISKKINPECVVVMGGPHATSMGDEVLKICNDVDYVVRGDGEESLLNLINGIFDDPLSKKNFPGISYRDGNSIVNGQIQGTTNNTVEKIIPDRTVLINESSYNSEDMGLIMTSRGCPYSCTYCATNTKRVHYRDLDRIVEEIRFVKKRYGTTQITFKDDSFTVNKKRVEDLCHRFLEENLNIFWECNTRVNLINEPLLRLMKKAGCNFVKIGVESGSEKILKKVNKKITTDHVRNAAKLLRKVGIHWTAYFLIGVPDETEDDIKETIRFLYELNADFACIGIYECFPGTIMFNEGVDLGLVKPSMTFDDFYNILPNHYYMNDPKVQTNLITPKRFNYIEEEVKKIIHRYNKNMFRVYKMGMAKSRIYLSEPKIFWEDFKKFLTY